MWGGGALLLRRLPRLAAAAAVGPPQAWRGRAGFHWAPLACSAAEATPKAKPIPPVKRLTRGMSRGGGRGGGTTSAPL